MRSPYILKWGDIPPPVTAPLGIPIYKIYQNVLNLYIYIYQYTNYVTSRVPKVALYVTSSILYLDYIYELPIIMNAPVKTYLFADDAKLADSFKSSHSNYLQGHNRWKYVEF